MHNWAREPQTTTDPLPVSAWVRFGTITITTSNSDPKRELLRQTLATLSYRGSKATCESSRTPGEILAHIGDLLDWGLSIAQGKERNDSKTLAWERETVRFFRAAEKLR